MGVAGHVDLKLLRKRRNDSAQTVSGCKSSAKAAVVRKTLEHGTRAAYKRRATLFRGRGAI
jgi:hypothetical protein